MKKILFLFALLYGATLMAQNKTVAVTEVVDREDKVSYATEIMVRTRLTAAISMKQGYTAYDRVDLQSIMSEQNFQRTGHVDDATIKRLGEMTGASLILIPEVAMSDDGKIYVAVKMLDVTTAQNLMSTDELMGNSSAEVEEGCRALTAKVLGVRSGSSSTTVAADEPVTLFGYIHVFPTDIGEFQTLPAQLLSAINKKATYGYDSWRLPTTEELSIIRANSHLIPNLKNADYLCSDSSTGGLVRLVTTEPQAIIRDSLRKKAIINILLLETCHNWHLSEDQKVIYRYLDYFSYKDTYGYSLGRAVRLMPKDMVMKISNLDNECPFYYICCEQYGEIGAINCGSSSSPNYMYNVRANGCSKYKEEFVGHYILTVQYDNNYYQRYADAGVILYYSYPSEDAIQQEMQKYY